MSAAVLAPFAHLDVPVDDFDVLIIGSGLAGLSAAVESARAGARVALVTKGPLCSGSSFSKATWGLGMIAPREASGNRGPESLSKALSRIGMNIESPALRDILSRNALAVPAFLESMGVAPLAPENPDEPQYVPCFDDELRSWRGFVGSAARDPMRRAIDELGVRCFENTEVLSLLGDGSSVRGALTLHKMVIPRIIRAKATILATGGFAGIWEQSICHPDCTGIGHLIALDAGAKLVNIEFAQLMLGFSSPTGPVIHNEKLYRHTEFDFSGHAHPKSATETAWRDALDIHAGHGPYTSRLGSRIIEEAVAQAAREGTPCRARYNIDGLAGDTPEFIGTYLRFLKQRKVDAASWFAPVLCAHSCNGGISIDEHATTSVDGLYACGEAAGGVHGADRMGGLASVAAIVFGRAAGISAAQWAKSEEHAPASDIAPATCLRLMDGKRAKLLTRDIARLMQRNLGAARTHEGLAETRSALIAHFEELNSAPALDGLELTTAAELQAAVHHLRARAAATLALGMCTAADLRSESRGSHARLDCPEADERLAGPSRTWMDGGEIISEIA